MPNGGADNCGECLYNKAVQNLESAYPGDPGKFAADSFCTLRKVNITNPYWTYCADCSDEYRVENLDFEREPKGWITMVGVHEGYRRIPWNDFNEPRTSVTATCTVCSRETGDGIRVEHEGEDLGFCCNRHYVEWWVSVHPGSSFSPVDYETPEQRASRERGKEG